MTKSPKPQQPKKTPAQALGGLKPSSSLPLSGPGGLRGSGLQGGSLGTSTPTGGLYGAGGTHGLPSPKAGGGPASGGTTKPGQKPGGKPTGVPRRTAG